jgi:hypothetical protein
MINPSPGAPREGPPWTQTRHAVERGKGTTCRVPETRLPSTDPKLRMHHKMDLDTLAPALFCTCIGNCLFVFVVSGSS